MAPPLGLLGPGAKPEDRLAALENALRQTWSLANSSLQIGPNQKSPVPGELIAGRITSPLPAGQPSMTLDLIQTSPGMGPVLTVSDGTYKRVQAGNLAAYTGPNSVMSPAEYGLRVLDQFGNVLFDSITGAGVLGILNAELGASATGIHSDAGHAWSTANNSTFTAIATNTTALSSQIRGGAYLVVGRLTAKVTAGTGFAYASIFLNGVQADAGQTVIFDSATSGYTTATQVTLATLPAGVSTLAWYGATETNLITGTSNSWSLLALPLTSVSY